MRVLQLRPTYLTLAEISAELGTSRHTVKTQVAAIYRRLQCSTTATPSAGLASWGPVPAGHQGHSSPPSWS